MEKFTGLESFDDFEDVLSQFNDSNEKQTEEILSANMSDEMKASQRRYEEYIKKHSNEK